jgi:hypothetical protein
VAETIEETRDRLIKELQLRRGDVERLYSYYRGEHPLPWAPTEVRNAYRALLRMSRTNWCRLIVQAPSERLRVTGMKFSDSSEGDVEAWRRYWQGNRLDRNARLVHDAALIARRGYVLVWPHADENRPPSITPEHPAQAIVDYKPGCSWERRAGLKTFVDPVAGRMYATLWTEGEVANWWTSWSDLGMAGVTHGSWQPWTDEDEGIEPLAANPLGEVPLIEFVPDPALLGEPMGRLDGGVTDIQDRVNKTVLDRMVTSNFSSFKQKWVTGLEIPLDDQGNEVEPFRIAVDRMLHSEDPETKFGEFSETDLRNYLDSVEADVQHLAAITRTPPHYLLGQSGAFPSGESLKATETGLVAVSAGFRDSFTEAWEDAIRLALKADDDERSDDMALSMVWDNLESRSIAEVVDAAVKLASIGVPWRPVMEFVGYSPTEIDVMDAGRAEDEANALLLAPPVAPGQPPPQPPPAAPSAPAA